MKPEYIRGFEEALELALTKIKNHKTIDQCRKEIEYLLSLVKERKIREIEQELLILR